MSKDLTPKTRVLTALNHQEPDRVPQALWGSYYTLNDLTYINILAHLKLGDPLPPFRRFMSRNSNYYDDRVLDLLDTDVRYIWSGFTDLGGANMKGNCIDAWGVKWEQSGPFLTSTGFPLGEATMEEIEDYTWPDPEKYFDFQLMQDRMRMLKKNYPNHAIAARAVNSYGPFEQASELRGREKFYMDIASKPELVTLLVKKCTDVIVRANEIFLNTIGKDIDFFEIPGDDYAANNHLIISPQSFQQIFKPELARIIKPIKEFRRDLPVAFHSDGAITKIIPDLVEIGLDILNPLEPLPATDWKAIKDEYGDQLCFMGGIDLREAMNGTKEDVTADVKRCLDIFGKGGGYILTPANHLQHDVPPENIVALFDAGRKLGRYPLN